MLDTLTPVETPEGIALQLRAAGAMPRACAWAMDTLMTGHKGPSAILTATDSLAIGALRWCQTHNLRVPDDLAIVGFDNIEFAEYASVPLSTVNYAVETVSSMAVDRLMQLIAAGDALPAPRVTQIEPDLVIRESTRAQR